MIKFKSIDPFGSFSVSGGNFNVEGNRNIDEFTKSYAKSINIRYPYKHKSQIKIPIKGNITNDVKQFNNKLNPQNQSAEGQGAWHQTLDKHALLNYNSTHIAKMGRSKRKADSQRESGRCELS